jgi:hypothetical protein
MAMMIDSSGTIGRCPEEPSDAVVDIVAELCRRGDYVQAHELLEQSAAEPEFQLSPSAGVRFRSYYGLTLAIVMGEINRGEQLCREAMDSGGCDPELSHNLGMVYLRRRRRDLAFNTFQQVLKVAPYFPETHRTLDRLGRRRKPLLPFLDRSHPVNRLTGKFLYQVRRAWESLIPASSA